MGNRNKTEIIIKEVTYRSVLPNKTGAHIIYLVR